MDPRDSPTPSSVISPATLSPTDSLPSLSSLPSLTFSSSSSSSAGQHKPTKLQIPEHTVEPRCRMKGEVVEYRSRNALARKISQLEEAGFQPVWSRENGYPGTIPEDIAEYIDINSQEYDELIGPLSSLFWLAGLDELVQAIDEPAFVLQDEVRSIPTNVGGPRWILEHLYEEGKIPQSMYNRYFWGSREATVVMIPVRLDCIPPQVSPKSSRHRLEVLFPAGRPQCLPQDIMAVRLKPDKNKARLSTSILNDYIDELGGGVYLYRVASRAALAAMMAFFVPAIHSNNLDNELGPGIYTCDSLEWVLKFGSVNNALMVFKNPDFCNLNVWKPPTSDWQQATATWTQRAMSHVPMSVPQGWRRAADVLQGPISKPDSSIRRLPVPRDISQTVAVSYAGCQALAKSLAMIIWFE